MRLKRLMASGLALVMALPLQTMTSASFLPEVQAETTWSYGIGDTMADPSLGYHEATYASIARNTTGTTSNNWRDGSMAGNGTISFIESADPDEDVFIFNNTKLVLGENDIVEVADVSAILDDMRTKATDRSQPGYWKSFVAQFRSQKYGTSTSTSNENISSNTKAYHPAAQLRIKNNDFDGGTYNGDASKYNRYCNFHTGEVGVQWKDANGKEWNRRTFASRKDNVIVTYIEAPEGESLDLTLSVDNLMEMGIDNNLTSRGAEIAPESKELIKQDANGWSIGQIVKYGDFNIRGSDENPDNALAKAGYATTTRLISADATITQLEDDVHTNTVNGRFNTENPGTGFSKEITTPRLSVKDTDSLMLVTTVDIQKTGFTDVDSVESLYDTLLQQIDGVTQQYGLSNNEASYQSILAPHTALHGEMFEGTTLELCATEEEIADRALTNTELNKKQQADTDINKAWLERLFYSGRFNLICASGYHTSRLGGIWVGNWVPDWSGDFTLDANVNLQVSGMNTTGLVDAAHSYINFTLRHAADWETNAKHVYGMTDAIMAPPRVDGDGNGQIYHSLPGYPFLYWNAGADWLILPIYEYWQCYGNTRIPVGEDIDLERLTSLLDLELSDIRDIEANGFDLEEHILKPMLQKLVNFWAQYTDERFYIDDQGETYHLNDGTTMGEHDRYLFAPGYSPENVPSKDMIGYNSDPSLAANTAMDISAAHNSMDMARQMGIETAVDNEESQAEVSLSDLEAKFPTLIAGEDGALKEWAIAGYEENYNHRHVSHTYAAWPGYLSKEDTELETALGVAMDMRKKYNTGDNAQAHGHLHNALVEARLGRVAGYQTSLHTLIASNYQYAGLVTSHNKNHASAFCTDNACGLEGVITEGLLYSNTGEIELFPSLVPDFQSGKMTGFMTRSNAGIDELTWNIEKKELSVTLTSNKDENEIKLKSDLSYTDVLVNDTPTEVQFDENGDKYIPLTLSAGQSVTVDYTLATVTGGTYAITDGQASAVTPKDNDLGEGHGLAMQSMTDSKTSSRFIIGNVTVTDENRQGEAFSNGEYIYFESVAAPGSYVNMHGGDAYIRKDDGKITLYTDAPYRYNNVFRITDAGNGYSYIETTDGSKLPEGSVLAVAANVVEASGSTPVADRNAEGVRITHQQKSENDAYQMWKIEQHFGYVTVKNKATGYYMNAAKSGAEVQQAAPEEKAVPEDTQMWNITEEGNGGFSIMNTYSGRTVTVVDGAVASTRAAGYVWKIENGIISTMDGTQYIHINENGELTLSETENTQFEFQLLNAVVASAIADTIQLSTTTGETTATKVNAAESVSFRATITPELAQDSELLWYVVDGNMEETDAAVISDTGVLTFTDDAKGNLYYVFATSIEGSCISNYFRVVVSNLETSQMTIECENYTYGFGNYKNETTNIGTINGDTVLKYSDVSVKDLKSIEVAQTNSNTAAKVQFYIGLTDDCQYGTESQAAYDGVYKQGSSTYDDSGNNGPTAMRRYLTSHIKSYGTAITAEEQIQGTKTLAVALPEGTADTCDLYMVIKKVSGTWAGNFDSFTLRSSSGAATYGDVNFDGKITAVDALLVLQEVSGNAVLTEQQKTEGDMDQNGSLDEADISAILDIASGKTE
ncbi:MAG: glycosyl hydrolase family 95 catalytic domain-containing protein [Lachnospiraceae bacterium]